MKTKNLIAPCGMNCALCQAYQGKGLKFFGCGNMSKRKSCHNCFIFNCKNKTEFCFEYKNYPCIRLKKLDKRYKTKYNMSMLENLDFIKNNGLSDVLQYQNKKYKCDKCGYLKTVHQQYCLHCFNDINKEV